VAIPEGNIDMFKEKFNKSIRFKFLSIISVILVVSTLVLSLVVAINEERMLKNSLMTTGRSFASYIAKLCRDPLIMKDSIQLDAVVDDANKDENIAYAVIRDEQGTPVTSQYASMNYRLPRLNAVLFGLSRDSELQDIIDAIKKVEPVIEVSTSVVIGTKSVGSVTVGMSGHKMHQQIIRTVLFTIALNVAVGFVLGAVLFVVSRKIVFDPLIELAHASSLLAKGDLLAEVKVETTGEVKTLVDSFNEMVKNLQKVTVSKDYVDNIIRSMINTLMVVSPDGKITRVNNATCKLLGYEEEELIGRPVETIFGGESSRKVSLMKTILADGHVVNIEELYRAKNGREVPVLLSASVIHDNINLIRGIVYAAQDITDRKQAEEERRSLEERLNRAEKMEALGTLAGGVAHDLNNVLGVVIGYSELLLNSVDESSSIRPRLMNIMKGGERAAAIVQDLLTLARRGVSGREVLNLNKIITDCQQSPEFEKLSSYHSSVQIKTDIESDLLNISGSSVHLGKTLFNLVSNASESMTKGGILTIKTVNQYLDKPIQGYDEVREGDYVVLSVSDTGEGIPAADLKRIFEPFYTKKVMGRSGTGLGLAVVWGTVNDHDGYINVQSEEGKGSIFTLYFPGTRDEISAEAVAIVISEYTGSGESILIVDDVNEQRDLAAEMLRKLNYNVTSVSSGEEAVAYLKEHHVDLMVLDMIMDPGMDGLDTYRSILEIHPKQKAIIVSGFSESDRVKAAQKLGAGTYVRKPYVIEKLGLAVRKELDRST
jgi:PAS domain S-box-containing protein